MPSMKKTKHGLRLLAASAMIAISTALATPGDAQADGTLRYVITGDLKILDPVYTTAAETIGHGLLVYDTLFAMNSKFEPQPQMVDNYEVSEDGLTWTFTLRDGMKWHDDTAVTAKDAVASLKRWGQKGTDASLMMERLDRMEVVDDLTFKMIFKGKFGPLLITLANPVVPGFIMREQDALTPPDQPVKEIIGSGPFKFEAGEWRPGSKIVYSKFDGYLPRNEPADGYAGGKVANVDKVEWVVIPDANTAAQALIAGEVDMMQWVPMDQVPILKEADQVTVKVTNPLGVFGHLRMNIAHAPFDDQKVRQAALMVVDQKLFNSAMAGDDPEISKVCYAVFGCGTPLESDIGAAKYRDASIEDAKALLKESSYDGSPVVIMSPTDWDPGRNASLLMAQALREIGMNVDVQDMDWSTLTQRRNSKDLPGNGSPGWDIFLTDWPVFTMSNPITNAPLVSACDSEASWYGWPCDETIEKLRAEFVEAVDPDDQKKIAEDLQKRFYEYVPYITTGQYMTYNAWGNDVKDVVSFMQLVFWNLDKE